jgi:hypothetical protein
LRNFLTDDLASADELQVNILADHPNQATIQIPSAGDREIQRIPCVFRGIEDKRLSLVSNGRVPAFTAVSVEYDDALFLGEVVACTEDVTHAWHVEIKVEQILTGLQSLMNLRASLLGEPAPAPLRMVPATLAH